MRDNETGFFDDLERIADRIEVDIASEHIPRLDVSAHRAVQLGFFVVYLGLSVRPDDDIVVRDPHMRIRLAVLAVLCLDPLFLLWELGLFACK